MQDRPGTPTRALALEFAVFIAALQLAATALTRVFVCIASRRPHPERARGAGLRQPAAGVPQAGHPDDVRDGPAAADAQAADLDCH